MKNSLPYALMLLIFTVASCHNNSSINNPISSGKITFVKKEAFWQISNDLSICRPVVILKLKNSSERDDDSYSEIRVVFINKTTGEQIGSDVEFFPRIFVSGTTTQISLGSPVDYTATFDGSGIPRNIEAKVYCNDDYLETIKIPKYEASELK